MDEDNTNKKWPFKIKFLNERIFDINTRQYIPNLLKFCYETIVHWV
jgi:hypothetical protein